MSERKVLNKYYPPDFDPSAIPKMRFSKNRTFNIRIMAPFNMRCNTCGGYIYKGKKFNSRKENVDEEFYLGLRIFRFYIKCPTCVAEIAFKTDLKNTDYTLEAGATRLFEAEKIAKEMAEREIKEKEEEELNNPMKILENRTKASRNEIETIDILEELRELSARQATVKTETMLKQHQEYEQYLQKLQEEEEEKEIRSIFGERENGKILKRLKDDEEDEDEPKAKKVVFPPKATDMLSTEPTNGTNKSEKKPTASWQRSVGGLSSSRGLKNLVRKKQTKTSSASSGNENAAGNTDIKADNGTIANSALQPGIQCEEKISENTNGDTNEVCTVPASKSDSPQSITKGNEPPVGVNQPKPSSDSSAVSSSSASLSAPVPSGSALGLLGLGYSDSDESDD